MLDSSRLHINSQDPSVESLEDAFPKENHFTSYKQVTRRNTCGGNVWSNVPPASTAREVIKTQEGPLALQSSVLENSARKQPKLTQFQKTQALSPEHDTASVEKEIRK